MVPASAYCTGVRWLQVFLGLFTVNMGKEKCDLHYSPLHRGCPLTFFVGDFQVWAHVIEYAVTNGKYHALVGRTIHNTHSQPWSLVIVGKGEIEVN